METFELNLKQDRNKELLLQALIGWQAKNINNYGKIEQDATISCIRNANALGLKNVCIFIDDELHGFCIYSSQSEYGQITTHCIKATHEKALGYELIMHLLAKWFFKNGVEKVNLNSNYGLLRLRMFLLTFGPMEFYRKYIAEPAK